MLVKVFLVLIAGYAALVLFTYLRQDSLLYYPVRELASSPRDIGLDYEDLALITKDGIKISAWFIPSPEERGVVLFCHGNAGNISHRLDSLRIFHELRLSVLIFDYRGYGRSEGKPSEEGTYLDAEAAWDYLTAKRGYPAEGIIIFGRSLGAAVAAEVAARKGAGGLIVESGFISVPDLASRYFPWLPVRMISRHRYAVAERLREIPFPKLIIHSPDDEVIPFAHGIALFEAATAPKEFLEISGGHNEGFLLSGSHYTSGLDRFVGDVLAGGQ